MAASPAPLPTKSKLGPKLILLAANKGGCGKTTTTIHLAVAAAMEGRKVAVVDFDPQASFAMWHAVRGPEYVEIEVVRGSLNDPREALDRVSKYEVVIADTPPGVQHNIPGLASLIRDANLVLIPTGLGSLDINQVSKFGAKIFEARGQKAHFLFNRIDSRVKLSERQDTQKTLWRTGKPFGFEVRDLVEIDRFMRNGISVADFPGRPGSDDVAVLWSAVKEEIGLE